MAIDLQQIGKRFRFYTHLKELEIPEIQKITGSDTQVLENIICGQDYMLDELVAIIKHFPDLNSKWLIYGEGSMFKPMNEDGTCTGNHPKDCLKKDKAQYLKQMQEMLLELDAAEVAKGHKPDMDALRAKIVELKDSTSTAAE
ncbi:hypothetical protein FVR03_00560 [Pontibacter qinzhouensis]|uniref:Uncharacterized protein n=1 Tax=Pontibacter qinzhouensis TaxID=2603253 RepID=A0A5C8KEC1_9BACT|nr:hypothetical protein [Pontibacter qinzhouensis]TXK52898.1 hypothetical protein FVR03_00560 [Pontibacter qinzhouensis]